MATQAQRPISTVPDLAAERDVRWPQRTKSKLANGLEIILLESRTIPRFHGELFFRSGNAAAADRAVSLAEMTATMLRTGTANRPSREIEERLRRSNPPVIGYIGDRRFKLDLRTIFSHQDDLVVDAIRTAATAQ